jgi:hypothetical protein
MMRAFVVGHGSIRRGAAVEFDRNKNRKSFPGSRRGIEQLEERTLLDVGGFVAGVSSFAEPVASISDAAPPPIIVASARLAVVRNGVWFFDMDYSGGTAEMVYAFGVPSDVPVAGDFDGNGTSDPAAFRNGVWLFDLNDAGGAAEAAFAFGIPGDVPVAGDWDGDGTWEPAVVRNGVWYFDLNGAGGKAEAAYAFGIPGDVPVAGDWNGDGTWEAAVVRNGVWYFDLDGAGGKAEAAFAFGASSDVPVAGNFNILLADEAVVFRNGFWFVDLDGTGGVGEMTFHFGGSGDRPLLGLWSTAAMSGRLSGARAVSGDALVPRLAAVENKPSETPEDLTQTAEAVSVEPYAAAGEVDVAVGVGTVENQRNEGEIVDDALLTLVAEWNAMGVLPMLLTVASPA